MRNELVGQPQLMIEHVVPESFGPAVHTISALRAPVVLTAEAALGDTSELVDAQRLREMVGNRSPLSRVPGRIDEVANVGPTFAVIAGNPTRICHDEIFERREVAVDPRFTLFGRNHD
jgi:hypothetical protein